MNNEVLPGLQTLGGQSLDPYATHISASYNDPAYQALPGQELDAAHDLLFNHPNVGPFVCRQLIQRTGPSLGDPAYQDADGHGYGFHPSCPELQTLFGEGKLATVLNVGTLVRPITLAQYLTNATGSRPPQLFSHSDQVTQWQTSIPDQPPATGWGGRVADIMNSVANPDGKISMSVSLNGANTLEIGNLDIRV